MIGVRRRWIVGGLAVMLGALGLGRAAVGATAPCLEPELGHIRAAATRADSIALADAYLASPPAAGRACADFLAGFLYGMTSRAAEDDWRHRQRAIELIESALRGVGDQPQLYLALGTLLYHRQSRTDALRTLDRAFSRREGGEVPLTARETALIHYTRGMIQQDFWRDWRSYGQLKSTAAGQWHCGNLQSRELANFTSSANDFGWLAPVNQMCPDRFAENMRQFFDARADMNRDAYRDMTAAFRAALATDSTFFEAAEALLGEWAYLATWEEVEPLARSLVARFPDDYRPLLYLGLALHETGRDSLAAPTFARAFGTMPDSIAAVFDDVELLLRPEQLAAMADIDSVGQQQVRVAFWNSLDPLYLTTVNERRVEHYARVVTAGLLFTSPALREPGWASFAGRIWIRYGRPAHIWELQVPNGRVVFWDFGPGPDVSFQRGFNARSYRPTDEAMQISNALSRTSPQSFAAGALFDTVLPLPSQVARTLGPGGAPQLLVYGAWPEAAGAEAMAGLTLLDAMYLPVAQWRGGRPNRPGIGAELNGMAAGPYSLTVEVWDRAARRLYRLRDTVSTLAVPDSSFVVSDLLLAADVRAPEADVASRRQLAVTPLYGSRIAAGDPVGLVWEVYRLIGPAADRLRYRVTVEVLDASRQPVLARVLRGVGVGGDWRPESRIAYESTRPVVDGRAVEWLELTSELEPGEYRIAVTLEDRQTNRKVTRERTLVVE
ncbi:MAG: GWxTD domain-containing protein [Gemmatimonadota bacterium]|nr:GWxTD domain-containing protein [Gemmatimonadota bacterium]